MRTMGAAVLLLCAAAGLLRPAFAEEACGPDKLGVARTATINASAGPQYGFQYRDRALLADGEVVLTFDDGPSRTYTRPILETLAAHCTRATFFMLGRMALADPQMVKDVAAKGHTIANHTWSHANLQSLSQDRVQDEIELGFSAVQHALGKPIAPFFRFPYLRHTPLALSHLGGRKIATFGIDVDSRDFQTREAPALYDRVMRDLTANRKGIILFHDIHASTARALPRILEELKWRGFRVVHLVPNAGVETLPEYDALAREQADSRRVAASGNPLSKRAVTWPSVALSQTESGGKTGARQGPSHPVEKDWTAGIWQQ
jgi:peptidoglycan/xylan/chitin deacetylase (PgdA/CDA1 family)